MSSLSRPLGAASSRGVLASTSASIVMAGGRAASERASADGDAAGQRWTAATGSGRGCRGRVVGSGYVGSEEEAERFARFGVDATAATAIGTQHPRGPPPTALGPAVFQRARPPL